MDSFIRFYSLYRVTSRWQVVRYIYSASAARWRLSLWLAKLVFVAVSIVAFMTVISWPIYIIVLTIAMILAWSFTKARTSAFRAYYSTHPDRIKYYDKDYQYIRYLMFKDKLLSRSFVGSIDDALCHLNGQIETAPTSTLSSHPFISVSIGALLAVVGGAAGQWNAKTVALVAVSLGTILYFAYLVLGITRTPLADLKEFKRFLLWAKEEP